MARPSMEDPKAEHSTPKQVPSPCSECPDSGSEGSELDCERTPTLYGILGVSIMAPSEVIRATYRRLARLWHPDRHCGDESAKRRFQEIQGAYEVLSDTTRRHEYDLNLLEHLDVEEYLSRYQCLILKCQGLGMASRSSSTCTDTVGDLQRQPSPDTALSRQGSQARSWVQLLKAA